MHSSYLINVIKTFVEKKQKECYTFIEKRLSWSFWPTFIPIFTYLHLIIFQHLLALNWLYNWHKERCGTDFTYSLGDPHSILQRDHLEGEAVVSLSSLMKVPAYTTPFNRGWLRSTWGHSPGWQWHIQQSVEQHWTVSEQTGKSASALGCVCHNLVALRISGEENIFRWQATQKEQKRKN